MIKKIVYSSLNLLACSLSFAGAMGSLVATDYQPKEDLYAGVGFGGRFSRNTETVTALESKNSTQTTVNANQVVGNVYIGFGHTWFDNYFLGIEANTYFPGYSTDIKTRGVSQSNINTNNFYTNRFTYSDYLGLDLLPGWRFNPRSLIYLRTGLSFRAIEVSQNATITPNSLAYYNSGYTVGGRFGAGVAHGITKNIGVAVDYFYTYYPRWGSYWSTYNLQQDIKSYQNYVGISLIYTS
jgi:hypothetical protein